MHLFRLLSLVQGSGCFLHAFFLKKKCIYIRCPTRPCDNQKNKYLHFCLRSSSWGKWVGRGFTVQHWQLEMYKTGQPCKRKRSINAVLWHAQKSNISLDEQKDWQHRLGFFFSFVLPLYHFFHSLWFFLSLSCLFMWSLVPWAAHKVLGMSLVAAIIITVFYESSGEHGDF